MTEEKRIQLGDGRILTFDEYYAEMNEQKRQRRRELAALPIERKLEIVRELQLLVHSCGRAPEWWVKDFAPKSNQ